MKKYIVPKINKPPARRKPRRLDSTECRARRAQEAAEKSKGVER